MKNPYLGRRHDGIGVHDAVRVLLSDLGDEEGAHSRAGASTKGVCKLEALQTVAVFRLLPHDVHDGVDEFSALGVVALGPVVAGAALSEDKVVRTEELADGAGTDGLHRSWFQIQEDRPWHILGS
jgi:hypothetical protein